MRILCIYPAKIRSNYRTHQLVGAPGNALPALGSSTACLCHDTIAHWSRSSFWRSISVTVAPFLSISFRSSESRNSLRFATALHHLERSLQRRKRRREEGRGRRDEIHPTNSQSLILYWILAITTAVITKEIQEWNSLPSEVRTLELSTALRTKLWTYMFNK